MRGPWALTVILDHPQTPPPVHYPVTSHLVRYTLQLTQGEGYPLIVDQTLVHEKGLTQQSVRWSQEKK